MLGLRIPHNAADLGIRTVCTSALENSPRGHRTHAGGTVEKKKRNVSSLLQTEKYGQKTEMDPQTTEGKRGCNKKERLSMD